MLLPPYRLADGRQVVLRPIRGEDKRDLALGFARLSPESVRLRFLTSKTRLSSTELRYLTEVDGTDHVALVAVMAHDPHFLVGVARYVRWHDRPRDAEVAVVIGDPWHGQGLGRHMGMVLADIARANGIRRFTASLLSDNRAARALLSRLTSHLRYEQHDGIEELVAELAA